MSDQATDARPASSWECPACGSAYIKPGTCGNNFPEGATAPCRETLVAVYAPNAQDIVDALRLVLTQDDASMEMVRLLMDEAPETDDARGVDLLLRLIRESRLKVALR